MEISCEGAHFRKDVILHVVLFYLRYSVSYRDLQEILVERYVSVNLATLNRWIADYALLIAGRARRQKRLCD